MYRFDHIRKATEDDIFFIRSLEMDPANTFVQEFIKQSQEALQE